MMQVHPGSPSHGFGEILLALPNEMHEDPLAERFVQGQKTFWTRRRGIANVNQIPCEVYGMAQVSRLA